MKRYKLKKAPIPIKGLEKVYTVYSNGDIVRNSTGNVLKPRPNWAGYMQVHLRYRDINRTVAVHRMVALAFIKKPNGDYQVDHKDNNKSNNAVENLQWLTAQENIIKAFKQGKPHPKGNSKTDRRGHRSPVAKLNEKRHRKVVEWSEWDSDDFGEPHNIGYSNLSECMVVIGNVHENADLLEKK